MLIASESTGKGSPEVQSLVALQAEESALAVQAVL